MHGEGKSQGKVGTRWVRQKIAFSLISLAAPQKTLGAYCELNFDATDLPHSYFEPLYPKVFKVGLKVDLVPIVGQTGPPKVRQPRYLAA